MYRNTEQASRFLVSDSPESFHGYILHCNDMVWPLFSHLENAVREGTSQHERAFGKKNEDVFQANASWTHLLISPMDHAFSKAIDILVLSRTALLFSRMPTTVKMKLSYDSWMQCTASQGWLEKMWQQRLIFLPIKPLVTLEVGFFYLKNIERERW